MPERRKLDRRDFSTYMRVMNEHTGELIGHLADISTGGFKLESRTPVNENIEFLMRMDLTNEVSNKDHLVFVARSRWSQRHPIDPTLYNIGFQIVEMLPEDLEIFIRVFEKYGTPVQNTSMSTKKKNFMDYFWR
jgi:hypothetical protein